MRGSHWVFATLASGALMIPNTTMAGPIIVEAKTVESSWIWRPKTIHLSAPKRVKWKNPTNEPHSVRFYKGPLKGVRLLLLEGEAKTKRIKKPGKYKYRCDIPGHSKLKKGECTGMCGKAVAQ